MSRRRRLALVLGGLALAGVVVLALVTGGRRIDQAAFDAVREGMTRDEVERLLGGPPRNECRGPVDVWVPGAGGELRSAELSPSGPAVQFFASADSSPGSEEVVWVSEAGLIAVRFGGDGRVRKKHFSTVHPTGQPSARGFVSRWFD